MGRTGGGGKSAQVWQEEGLEVYLSAPGPEAGRQGWAWPLVDCWSFYYNLSNIFSGFMTDVKRP